MSLKRYELQFAKYNRRNSLRVGLMAVEVELSIKKEVTKNAMFFSLVS